MTPEPRDASPATAQDASDPLRPHAMALQAVLETRRARSVSDLRRPPVAGGRMIPAEYAVRTVPDAIELCARCLAGLVFRRGADASLPYCPKCGHEAPGVPFARVRVDGDDPRGDRAQ